MLTGAYSQKFKDLEQEHLRGSGSNDSLSHAQQLAARDKVRQLSLETNRRRRAQELKRRLEAQKEAKRRQEVLEERRRRQQEATQRYQRGQRGSPKTRPRANSGKVYTDSRLQDGVNIARGYSQLTGNHGNRAPALEEALRMVGVSTAPASTTSYTGGGYLQGGMDYSTGFREVENDSGMEYNQKYHVTDAPHRRQPMDGNGNAITENKGHSYHGYTTTATTTYNSNVNRDATGVHFQQTLQEQQRRLMEQQQAALNEFNQAVLSETLPSQGEELQRSSSLSSLDSLEEAHPKSHKNNDRRHQPGSALKSVHAIGKPKIDFVGSTVGVDVTSVNTIPTRTAHGNGESRLMDIDQSAHNAVTNDRLFTSQPSAERHHPPSTGAQSKGLSNGELLVEETSESDFVHEPVETKPTLLQGSKELQSHHPTYGVYSSGTSNAWVSQAPTEVPQFHNAYDANHSPGRYTTGPVSVQPGHRPFSARTTATAVSNYPARVPEPPAEYSRHYGPQKHEQEFTKRTMPNSIANRAVNVAPTNAMYSSNVGEDSNYARSKYSTMSSNHQTIEFQQAEAPIHAGKPLQKDGTETEKQDRPSETSEKTVRSILKRGPGYSSTPQKVKLGGVKVKDSLEISRASQGSKSDRKSVRWTDLKYSDEVDVQKAEKVKADRQQRAASESSVNAERPRAAVTQPVDDTSRGQAKSDRHIVSAGTPPRGPTKLSRVAHNASKPPPGRPNPGSYGKQTESVNPQTVSKDSGKVLSQQQEIVSKYAPGVADDHRVYQNGVRLDKTPTDEEINWLWDKVRTCLNTQDQGVTGQTVDPSSSRQPASVSKQFIDGNRLTANLRVSTQGRVNSAGGLQDHPLTNQKKYNTYPRFRTSSDSSATSLRKTALLQQRRQHSAVGNLRPGYQGRSTQQYMGPVLGLQPSPPTSASHHQPGPTASSQGPTRTAGGVSHGQDQEVSESLLAFQQAERLAAQENLSESEIAAAMEHQKNHAFMQKVPTALSMEEQRILESLDKLNAQLRTVTSDTSAAIQPYMMMQPKPPPQGSSFRNQRPLSSRQRAIADANITHRTRTLSADRSNARINYYH